MNLAHTRPFALLGLAIIISCAPPEITVSNNQPATLRNVVSGTPPQAEATAAQTGPPVNESIYQGNYTNRGFGFSLTIPEGYKGIGSPPETPQHGVVIPISPEGDAKLYVDGSYNALLLDSLEELYEKQIDYLREDAQTVKLDGKKATLLGGQPAVEFTAVYTDKNTGKVRATRQVLSKRTCSGEDAEIIYKINLDISEAGFPEGKRVMEQVLKSWKMLDRCG